MTLVSSSFLRFRWILIAAALFLLIPSAVPAGWLSYDEGEPAHAGSGMRYQGVRFTLPDTSVRATLQQVSFYYATAAPSCPVKIHVTDHGLSRMIPIRSFDAVDGWNFVDLTASTVAVPHNFYVVVENRKCGFLMLDNDEVSDRSFKGNHLKSLKTRLSHDLLIRAEIGEPLNIPLSQTWNVSVTEKRSIRQTGVPVRKDEYDFAETWRLFADSSLVIDDALFGAWRQKKQKFSVSLDFEEVRGYLFVLLCDIFADTISDIIVTKASFTGIRSSDESIRGTLKLFAKISFFENAHSAKMSLERTYVGVPRDVTETFSEVSE